MHTTIISRSDLHLLKLLAASARLRKKLAAATVVPAPKVPADVVTMNSALLGAAVGQELDADIPGAGRRQLRVDEVISQPERQVRRPCLAASDALAFSLGF
jgi:hypothetical protein